MELTGLKGGRDRMKSRMMSWASLLTFGGILPSTNTGFNLYLNANNRSYSSILMIKLLLYKTKVNRCGSEVAP